MQDKVWVTGTGRERWEVYTVLADARPDLDGQTGGAVDCDQATCSCQGSEPAAEQTGSPQPHLAAKTGYY